MHHYVEILKSKYCKFIEWTKQNKLKTINRAKHSLETVITLILNAININNLLSLAMSDET